MAKRIALIFPGQGSQAVGMGKSVSEGFAAARSVFDEANNVLGFDIARLCFEGPEDELTLTKNSQPAIFAVSIACLRALEEEIASPLHVVASAGLSLGEFSAHVAAGSFSFADGLALVRKRGEAMQEACDREPGAMASIVGLGEGEVREMCERLRADGALDIANLNCPGQIAVSGSLGEVEAAMAEAERRGAAKVVRLQVSGAFHSRLMKPAEEKLKEALRCVEIREPGFPVIANASAAAVSQPEVIRRALLTQLCSPVLWERSMRGIIEAGVDLFLECGHGRILRGLMRRIERSAKVVNVQDADSVRKTVRLLREEEEKNHPRVRTATGEKQRVP